MISHNELLACAVSAARTSADHAVRNFSRRDEVAKRFKHDVKLRLDIECQAKAEEVIRAGFPHHEILGEEDPDGAERHNTDSGYEWIIDPIDGTVNFSHGSPLWCCSVAVRRGKEIVAGAVYSPVVNQLYTAAAGEPALCNGKPIHVSAVKKIEDAIVCTGVDKNIDGNARPFAVFEGIATGVQRVRMMGCAAMDICRVARGEADGYFEASVYIWDVAAAGLVVRQAGGAAEVLTHYDAVRLSFIATNGRIHKDLMSIIDTARSTRAS